MKKIEWDFRYKENLIIRGGFSSGYPDPRKKNPDPRFSKKFGIPKSPGFWDRDPEKIPRFLIFIFLIFNFLDF